jgi:CBS-domain-containing membrane protein
MPKEIKLKVKDIMHTGVTSVREDMNLVEAAQFLLHHSISGATVVSADNKPVGVVSMSDLVAHAAGLDQADGDPSPADFWNHGKIRPLNDLQLQADHLVRDVMTTFVVRVDEESPLTDLIDLVCETHLHRVLVTRGEEMTGIVTTIDLVRALGRLIRSGDASKHAVAKR